MFISTAQALLKFEPKTTDQIGNNIKDNVATTITFDAIFLNKGSKILADDPVKNHFDFKLKFIPIGVTNISTVSAFAGAVFGGQYDDPKRDAILFPREILFYNDVTVQFTLSNAACKGISIFCILIMLYV